VEALGFDTIHERYYSGNFKYVIGKVKLQNLIAQQQRILNSNAFVAFAGELSDVQLVTA
jgi:homoserine dehydrogenase